MSRIAQIIGPPLSYLGSALLRGRLSLTAKKVAKETRPQPRRRSTMKLSPDALRFSATPGHRNDGPSMARRSLARIHASQPLRPLRCSAPLKGADVKSKALHRLRPTLRVGLRF